MPACERPLLALPVLAAKMAGRSGPAGAEFRTP
jgi:hypothetical protein